MPCRASGAIIGIFLERQGLATDFGHGRRRAGCPGAIPDVCGCLSLSPARPGLSLRNAGCKEPGSPLVGLLSVFFMDRRCAGPPSWAGFLGAFRTFSAFLGETLALIDEGYVVRAFLNRGMSLLVCLLACWVGLLLGRSL
jgi:hypothetical protein